VLDPPSPPANFAAMPNAPCPLVTSAVGEHTVYAASTDAAGNVGPVAQARFRIIAPPETTITSGASGETWLKTPFWTFTSSVQGSTFECRIDGGAFARCSSPFTSAALSPGQHSFEVRAVGPEGVVDPTPDRREFTTPSHGGSVNKCRIDPFMDIDGAIDFQAPPSACSIWSDMNNWPAGDSSCARDYKCVSTGRYCPMWAVCSVTMTAQWYDADKRTDWRISTSSKVMDYVTTVCGGDASYCASLPTAICSTGVDGDRCRASHTSRGVRVPVTSGASSPFGARGGYSGGCYADPENDRVIERGPDHVRRLECELTMQAEPASVLQATAVGTNLQLVVPGPGAITIRPDGTRARLARGASAKPVFEEATVQATDAGLVSFKPKLSKKGKRKLKRKGLMTLKLASTYVPAGGGDPIAATQRVTLIKRAKPPKLPGPRLP
jgi:hypothetical protein